jgi:hypothetical protein
MTDLKNATLAGMAEFSQGFMSQLNCRKPTAFF